MTHVRLDPVMVGDAFLDLVLGGRCVACGMAGRTLCVRCRVIVATGSPRPHRPDPCPPGFPATVVTGSYEGPWPGILAAYKENGVWGLAPVLADRLWPALVELVLADDPPETSGGHVLVPMPSRRSAVRDRGLDTTAALTRRMSRLAYRSGWALPARPGLRFVRRVADSAGLDSAARSTNLVGAIRLSESRARLWRERGTAVILCDDLVTTGASLVEASRAVRAAGVTVRGAVALVATPRRHGVPGVGR